MIDVFSIASDGVTLDHVSGVKIISEDKDPKHYWADEGRLSTSTAGQGQPKYLYASTRGLNADTKGYVAVFALDDAGRIANHEPIDLFETETSGGWANAVEPAPRKAGAGHVEYFALTDSEKGWVFVLGFDGTKIRETGRVRLDSGDEKVAGAATAVWL